MNIIGIDPGTLSLGYGVIDGDSFDVLDWGVIEAPSSLKLEGRLYRIYKGLEGILVKYLPAEIAIEEPFVFKNPRSAISIGRGQGVVLLLAAQYNIPLFRYSPTQVKQQVTGYGMGDKYQVKEMVIRQLSLPLSIPEDASDALAIALCHAIISRSSLKGVR